MIVQEVIDRVDRIKPNGFTNDDKVAWLDEVEGRVQTEFLLLPPEKVERLKTVGDKLLVPFPYDALYVAYLMAMIDFANGEYDRYDATYEMFNAKWKEFAMWRTTHYPTKGNVTFGVTEVEK